MKTYVTKLGKRLLSVILVVALLVNMWGIIPVRAAVDLVVTGLSTGVVYMVRNKSTGLYMTGSSDHSVKQQAANGSIYQRWTLTTFNNGTALSSVAFPDLRLQMNDSDNMGEIVLDVETSFGENNNRQQWDFVYKNDGTFHIQTQRGWGSDRPLVGVNGYGAAVVMRDFSDTSMDRRWEFIAPGTVTYNYGANNGSPASGAKTWDTRFVGEYVDTSPQATKPNAEFRGWNTSRTATSALSIITMPDSNLEVFAIFRDKQPVTYNYEFNGGTSATKASDLKWDGEAVDLSPTATKANARFLGWHTDPNAKTPLTSLTMPYRPLTLYAIFEDKLQLTYHPNGGTTPSPFNTAWYFEDETVPLGSPTSTKTDATFLGWNKNANDKTPLSSLKMPGSALTLYAVFKDKQVVTYNYTYNGGTRPANQPASAKFYEGETITPLPTDATKTDARFLGWSTNPNAKKGDASIKPPGDTSIKMTATGLTLYAIFEDKIQVTYNYTANGGKSVTKASNKFYAGDDVDLSPTAAKDNARFLGWHTNAASKTVLTAPYKMPNTPLTLYAIFEDKVPVNYNYAYNGGTSVTTPPYGFYVGDPVALTPVATKAGWDFLGWHTDPNAIVPLDSLTMPNIAMPGGSLTLYAIYRLTTPVAFVDYDNSGIVTRTVFVITYNQDVPAPSTHTLTAPAQNTPDAWTPLGWTHIQTAGVTPVISPAGGTLPF